MPFTFGIYPGGAAGGDQGIIFGPEENADLAVAALEELRGSARKLVIRCYDSFQDPGSPLWQRPRAPQPFERYVAPGIRPMDLVLQYRSASGDVPGYLDFVRRRVEQWAPLLHSVQITEEANFSDGPPVIDGPYPGVCTALVEGLRVASETRHAVGRPDIQIGFNSTPTFGAHAIFWDQIRNVRGMDYVALDFFPDVFRRVPEAELQSAALGVVEAMRSDWLPRAGIGSEIPIRIAEHGWPTPAGRTPERQSEVIEEVVRVVHENCERLHVDGYSLFALRDALVPDAHNGNDLFSYFGIMTAHYHPKPAFARYRGLIQELAE